MERLTCDWGTATLAVMADMSAHVRLSCGTTLSTNQGRLRMPPQAARAIGPPRSRPCRMDQSREAHRLARSLLSPEGGKFQDS